MMAERHALPRQIETGDDRSGHSWHPCNFGKASSQASRIARLRPGRIIGGSIFSNIKAKTQRFR